MNLYVWIPCVIPDEKELEELLPELDERPELDVPLLFEPDELPELGQLLLLEPEVEFPDEEFFEETLPEELLMKPDKNGEPDVPLLL